MQMIIILTKRSAALVLPFLPAARTVVYKTAIIQVKDASDFTSYTITNDKYGKNYYNLPQAHVRNVYNKKCSCDCIRQMAMSFYSYFTVDV